MNRGGLIDTFGISVNQISTDLNRHRSLDPKNMDYDKSAKTYLRKSGFGSQFLKLDASCYRSQLRSRGAVVIDASDSWTGAVTDFHSASLLARSVSAVTLKTTVAAKHLKEAIEIKFKSLYRPEPKWRWIARHALGADGFRWHARAWCSESSSFRDHLLSRILDTRGTRKDDISSDRGEAWSKEVTLKTGSHPALSEARKNVGALDYYRKSGRTKIKVRNTLFYHALTLLGLDTDPAARRPQDQQIVLMNIAHLGRAAP